MIRTDRAVRRRAGAGKALRGRSRSGVGAKRGGGRNTALGGIAAVLVIGLAACGSAVAGAGAPAKPASKAKLSAAKALRHINPGGPMIPAVVTKNVLLCAEIPALTRLTFTRMAWPPTHAREVLPAGFTVRDPATVRRIATILCGLPRMPVGAMSCPNLAGASYHIYFSAPGRAFPAVAISLSGCRTVAGLGPLRTWITSAKLQQALSQGLGNPFKRVASPLP